MIGNSLVGVTTFFGEPATLVHVTGQTYNTSTLKPVITAVKYSCIARIHQLTDVESRRLGADLVQNTTAIATIPASQLPDGVEPDTPDQLAAVSGRWAILKVRTIRVHGIVVEHECQLAESDVPYPGT